MIELTGNKDYSLFILGLTPTLVIVLTVNRSTDTLVVLSGSTYEGKYCWALVKVGELGLL